MLYTAVYEYEYASAQQTPAAHGQKKKKKSKAPPHRAAPTNLAPAPLSTTHDTHAVQVLVVVLLTLSIKLNVFLKKLKGDVLVEP